MFAARSAPLLLAITPEQAVRRPDLGLAWLAGLCEGHAQSGLAAHDVVVQIRDKEASDEQLSTAISLFRGVPGANQFRWVISRRFDLLGQHSLNGVHCPGSYLHGAPEPKQKCLVGVSCHSLLDIEKAAHRSADYAVFGPVFDTPSKRAYGVPQGLEELSAACALGAQLGLAILAIGGIDSTNCRSALDSGAHGVAAIRSLGTKGTARDLCSLLNEMRSPRAG